jgi:hypothetical protein
MNKVRTRVYIDGTCKLRVGYGHNGSKKGIQSEYELESYDYVTFT